MFLEILKGMWLAFSRAGRTTGGTVRFPFAPACAAVWPDLKVSGARRSSGSLSTRKTTRATQPRTSPPSSIHFVRALTIHRPLADPV